MSAVSRRRAKASSYAEAMEDRMAGLGGQKSAKPLAAEAARLIE